MAQAMVVLLALHLMQVVIDGAYRAPREVNFWLGLVLMMLVLGMALTGYLLPWDQKGYWATRVATNLAGLVPLVGPSLQQVVVGGPDYGHHTLTRFFAIHAGFLPLTLVLMLVVHLSLFRKHGLCGREHARADRARVGNEERRAVERGRDAPRRVEREELAAHAVGGARGGSSERGDTSGHTRRRRRRPA
jgi:ubiquinol-cytochrome c reductase cytochrome b subunit